MFRYLWLVIASFLVIANLSCKQTTTASSDTSEGVVATKEPNVSSSVKATPDDEKDIRETLTETETKKTQENSNSKSKEKVTQRPLPIGVPKPLTTPQEISPQETQNPQQNKGDFEPTPLPGKGAKPIKKKPIAVKTKPTVPAANTKIVTLTMKPPTGEHQYEIQLTMAERTPKESYENKATVVEGIRTSRDSSCNIRIAKVTISGDKGKVKDFLQSLKRARWSATFDKQGILKNVKVSGLNKSTALMALGASEGGVGFLNIIFPSKEVTTGANWLYTLRMNRLLEGWFPAGVRIFGLDNTMMQFKLDEIQQKNNKTTATISYVLEYSADGRRKIGKEEKPMTIMVRSRGNAIVDTKTGLPEEMSVQSSVYFTGADADKTITIIAKGKKIK
ncbi:MAG TPA: hypothetical protein VNK96_07105 [Fimbriimonadales bacterium]|nr:hypothetical protein [Fimbriimonadales bacterium]